MAAPSRANAGTPGAGRACTAPATAATPPTRAPSGRAGAPIRADKTRQRIQRGEWVSPRATMTEEQIRDVQSRVARKGRQREVAEGRWRNPALSDEARQKLSRPRKHGDNPVLHSALEKIHQGMSMADLAPEEREAYRARRRYLHSQRRDAICARQRQRYRQQMSTQQGRDDARQRWRLQRERLARRNPNTRLAAARQAAGLSQEQLAQAMGVAHSTVVKWERFSIVPRNEQVRRRVVELLGEVWGE